MVAAAVTAAATPRMVPYQARGGIFELLRDLGRSGRPGETRVRREGGAKLGDLAADRPQGVRVAPGAQRAADELGDPGHLPLAHPGGRLGGGAEAEPGGDERRAGVVGDGVAVAGDPVAI